MLQIFSKKKINGQVYAIKDIAGYLSYLVIGREKAMLIDTGAGIGNIKKFIEKITNKPIIIVNTHVHPDHSGGNVLFEEVYISKEGFEDADMLTKKNKIAMAKSRFKNPVIPIIAALLFAKDKPYKKIAVHENTVFNLGGITIRCFETPGHTKSCISYYWEEQKVLFSGDFVKPEGVWLFLNENAGIDNYINSLNKIEKLKINEIYPGHVIEVCDKKLVSDLLICAKKIIENPDALATEHTFMGKRLRCDYSSASIIY